MPGYYIISIENKTEYFQRTGAYIQGEKIGTWLMTFFDVNWEKLAKESLQVIENDRTCAPLFNRYYDYFVKLKKELCPIHPFLDILISEKFMGEMFSDALPLLRQTRQKKKRDFFRAFKHGGNSPDIDDELLRRWLHYIHDCFDELAELQKMLLPEMEYIMLQEDPARKTILEKYYWVHTKNNFAYEIYARSQYQKFQVSFELMKNSILYNCMTPGCEKPKKMEANTFLTTDSLVAVTVFEFDNVCARNIPMQRCANCNRWFVRKTKNNRFCSRPSPQNPERTCQEVGPNLCYQEKIEGNPIADLARDVKKRVYEQAKRELANRPNAMKIYNIFQLNVDNLKEKAERGEITDDQFVQAIDHPGADIIRNKGELFPYDPIV